MNQEKFTRFWKQLKTPLMDKWDKLTEEDLMQIDGNLVKFHGVLDQRYGDQKEAVSTWVNRRYSHINGDYEGYEYAPLTPEPAPK